MAVTALDAYFFIGSKVEMERLEENFVTGVWSPPFADNATPMATCNSAEPPNKRRPQQKTKTTSKGKGNNKQQKSVGKDNKQHKSAGKGNKQQQISGKEQATRYRSHHWNADTPSFLCGRHAARSNATAKYGRGA